MPVYKAPLGDWIPVGGAWTYSSVDGATGVITIPSDGTTIYQPGMRVKLTQTTVKYFIVTAVSATTLTVYGGTDYTLANAAISAMFYSSAKAPLGFSLLPSKWMVQTANTGNSTQTSPTVSTWYNLGTLTIVIPIGAWDVHYQVSGFMDKNVAGNANVFATLSTANNSQSDANWTTRTQGNSIDTIVGSMTARKYIEVASKTTYYLNMQTDSTAASDVLGNQWVLIRAVCAYL